MSLLSADQSLTDEDKLHLFELAYAEAQARIAALEEAIESALVVLGIDLSDEKRWQAAEILRLALGRRGAGDE